MYSSQLLERTLQLVAERPRTCTFEVLSKETGIPATWLKHFARGKIDDPGVIRVEKLYVFFTKASLELV
jgi:hypothetical protein